METLTFRFPPKCFITLGTGLGISHYTFLDWQTSVKAELMARDLGHKITIALPQLSATCDQSILFLFLFEWKIALNHFLLFDAGTLFTKCPPVCDTSL